MSVHADILENEPDEEERFVGRVEVVNGIVSVTESADDPLEQLVLIPRFLPDGTACSMTDDPMRYLEQLAEDLREGLTMRATALHTSDVCPY